MAAARLERVRELVFGSLDGLLVSLGVISAVRGGMRPTRWATSARTTAWRLFLN